MARGPAEVAYRLLEFIYGLRVTDELLRSRGEPAGREEFLSRELRICLAAAIAAAALFAPIALALGLPPILDAPMSAAVFVEVFVLAAGLRGRAIRRLAARAPPRAAQPPVALKVAESRNPLAKVARLAFPEDRVRRLVELSDLRVPADYFYGMDATAATAGAAVGAAALGLLAALERYPPPALALWAIVGLLAGMSVGLLAPYSYLSYRAGSRSSRIEQDLSTWAAAMMAYVSSGASFPEALRRSALALRDGPLRRELERIIRDSEVLGSDPRTSLLAMAERSPSQLLREVVVGLMDTMDSGKDLQEYFRESLSHILGARRNYIRKLVNDVALAAELFVMIFVVTPLILAIMLAVMGSMTVGAQAYYGELLAIIAFAFIPMVGIGYLLLVDSIYPRWW